MEILVSVFVYMLQVALILSVSGWLCLLIGKIREKRRKAGILPICLLLVVLLLASLARRPVLQCGSEYLSSEDRKSIMCVSGGLYSSRLPLIPVYIRVENASAPLRWRIYYLPFGYVEMTHGDDGYDITKPLI